MVCGGSLSMTVPSLRRRLHIKHASCLAPAASRHKEIAKNQHLLYNNPCVYRRLVCMCGSLITILAAESCRSLWRYTIHLLIFSRPIIPYPQHSASLTCSCSHSFSHYFRSDPSSPDHLYRSKPGCLQKANPRTPHKSSCLSAS